jgi:hypothetical protein
VIVRPAVADDVARALELAVAPPVGDLLGPRPYRSMDELLPEAPPSLTNITDGFVANLFHRNLNVRPAEASAQR